MSGLSGAASLARCRCWVFYVSGCRHRANVIVDFALGLFLGHPIGFLNSPNQLIAFAGNHIEIAVCEFAPFLFHRTLVLFPLAFHLIPVHSSSLYPTSMRNQTTFAGNTSNPASASVE